MAFNGKPVQPYHADAPVSASNPLPVTGSAGSVSVQAAPFRGTLTDRSGTASTTSTQIMAANSSRTYLFIENLDISIDMHVNFTSAATVSSGSVRVPPGASYIMESGFVSTEAVFLRSASGTPLFTAKEGS